MSFKQILPSYFYIDLHRDFLNALAHPPAQMKERLKGRLSDRPEDDTGLYLAIIQTAILQGWLNELTFDQLKNAGLCVMHRMAKLQFEPLGEAWIELHALMEISNSLTKHHAMIIYPEPIGPQPVA